MVIFDFEKYNSIGGSCEDMLLKVVSQFVMKYDLKKVWSQNAIYNKMLLFICRVLRHTEHRNDRIVWKASSGPQLFLDYILNNGNKCIIKNYIHCYEIYE